MKVLEDSLQTWIAADITEPVYLLMADDDSTVYDDDSTFVVFAVSEEQDQKYLNSQTEYSADVELRVYSPDKYYPRDLIDRIVERVTVEQITGINLLNIPEVSAGNGEPAGGDWFYYPLNITIDYKEL